MGELICQLAIILTAATHCPEQALASRYDLGPTEATLAARLDMGHITPEQAQAADSYIAVKDCENIGKWAYIRPVGGEWRKALVYDCATRNNQADQEFMDIFAVEVDAWTAEAWGFDCLCPFDIEIVRGW